MVLRPVTEVMDTSSAAAGSAGFELQRLGSFQSPLTSVVQLTAAPWETGEARIRAERRIVERVTGK
jgi:hypothetical protein